MNENRSQKEKCTATNRQGNRCGRWPVPGATVCKLHGGGSPAVKAAAARRRQQEAAQKAVALFGAPRNVDPAQALLDLVHWTAGEVEYWRERVRELAEQDDEALTWGKTREKTGGQDVGDTYEAKPAIQYVMLYAAQDRLAQYAAAALKAGVQERQVRLAETQGAMVGEALRRILDSLLDALLAAGMAAQLRDVWAESVTTIVPRELRAIAGGEQS